MPINRFIEDALKRSVLKRVWIKVDPRESSNPDLHLSSAYEGYILEEDDTTVKIYFVNTPQGIEPVQTVDKKHIIDKPVNQPFKTRVCKTLVSMGIKNNNPVVQQIKNLNNLEFLDTYLKQLGFDDAQLAAFYKKMCLGDKQIVEGALGQGIKAVAQGIKNVATSPVTRNILKDIALKSIKAVGNAPKLYVGKGSVFNRLARFLKSFDLQDLITFENSVRDIKPGPKKGQLIYITFDKEPGFAQDAEKNAYHIIGQFGNEQITENMVLETFSIKTATKRYKNVRRGTLDYAAYSSDPVTITLVIDDPSTPGSYKTVEKCYSATIKKFKNIYLATLSKAGLPTTQCDRHKGYNQAKGVAELYAAIEPAIQMKDIKEPLGSELYKEFIKIYPDKAKKAQALQVIDNLLNEDSFQKLTDNAVKAAQILAELKKITK